MAQAPRPSGAVSRRVVATYAAGSVGTGGFATLPGLVLAYYLTDTLGVAATVASVVVVIPKLIDVALNPLIGAASDTQAARTGRRRGLMTVGAAALFPLFILMFLTPTSAGPLLGAVWVLVFFSAAAVAYALFQVPYVALPADLTDNYHERTRLVTSRIAVLAAAILLVGAGGPAIRDAAGGGALGYAAMAIVVATVIAAGMLTTTVWATPAVHRPGAVASDAPAAATRGSGWRVGYDAVRQNPEFRILLSVFVVQALATAVMLAGAQYVATYVLGRSSALTLMFVALVAPAILVMPVWYRVARRHGKVAGLTWSSTIFLLATASMVLAVWYPGWWIIASVAAAGVGYAGMQAFPLALLPDLIAFDASSTGHDRGGAMAGVWTAGETVGLTLGPGVLLLILAAGGFVSSTDAVTVTQPGSAITAISLGFAAVPAALTAVSVGLLSRYREPRQREAVSYEQQ